MSAGKSNIHVARAQRSLLSSMLKSTPCGGLRFGEKIAEVYSRAMWNQARAAVSYETHILSVALM